MLSSIRDLCSDMVVVPCRRQSVCHGDLNAATAEPSGFRLTNAGQVKTFNPTTQPTIPNRSTILIADTGSASNAIA